jgi:hypothetical protein
MIFLLFFLDASLSQKITVENYENSVYSVTFYIGTPPQRFKFALGTRLEVRSMQWSWVDKLSCDPCHEYRSRFSPEKSSTFQSFSHSLTFEVIFL